MRSRRLVCLLQPLLEMEKQESDGCSGAEPHAHAVGACCGAEPDDRAQDPHSGELFYYATSTIAHCQPHFYAFVYVFSHQQIGFEPFAEVSSKNFLGQAGFRRASLVAYCICKCLPQIELT